MILVLFLFLRNVVIIRLYFKFVFFVVGIVVDIFLFCGVLLYGVNFLGVNLCESLDLNVWGVVIYLFVDVLVFFGVMFYYIWK